VTLLASIAAVAVLLPGFTPSVQPGGGTVLTGTLPGTFRPGAIYLPPDYSAARRYPVVYLLHGMPGSPGEYLGGGIDLAAWADASIGSGTVRPFIAVLPAAGLDHAYNGEWAGPWERAVVQKIVPWVDAHLSTIRSASGRVIAGLSAGGFGAADIALRNPSVFGRVESWSGYFRPLDDGPFKHASKAELAANNPLLLARSEAAALRRGGMKFFLSTGPFHSHWFQPKETLDFARELRRLGLTASYHVYASAKGEWRTQLGAGLDWAFRSAGNP
jgi:Putative esterase